MAEEFHESDVIFSDHHHHHHRRHVFHPPLDYGEFLAAAHRNSKKNNTNKKKKKKDFTASSLPVQIPESIFRYTSDTEEEWDSDDMVPPHVLIGRRVAGKMAFSLCSGNGRTLKGRDLSQVRNSILRMTGFLET